MGAPVLILVTDEKVHPQNATVIQSHNRIMGCLFVGLELAPIA